MAKRTILGIDIGYNQLKLALVKGTNVKKVAVAKMPENLLKDGWPVSVEAMGELLRRTMKAYKIRAKFAAITLPEEMVYLRTLSMPVMTADQLNYNLPFEFRDYISDDFRQYRFDYAMITSRDEIMQNIENSQKAAGEENEDIKDEDVEPESPQMELLATAVNREYIEDLRSSVRKAGLKLRKAAPTVTAYGALVRNYIKNHPSEMQWFCFVDLGYNNIRIHVFAGDRYDTTKELDMGMVTADEAIADAYGVDVHLAHTYLTTNYDNCQTGEACENLWNSISVEIMRFVNFYHFSMPDSSITDVWLCGGGVAVEALQKQIAQYTNLNVHLAGELVDSQKPLDMDPTPLVQAVGITLELG